MKIKFQHKYDMPGQGKALICFRTSLYYGAYKREGDVLELEGNIREMSEQEKSEILEIHLFDAKQEYRAIYSQTKKGYIETLVDDPGMKADVKIEEQSFLLPEYEPEKKIGVANYLRYDENDMLELVNYRLYIPEEEAQDDKE